MILEKTENPQSWKFTNKVKFPHLWTKIDLTKNGEIINHDWIPELYNNFKNISPTAEVDIKYPSTFNYAKDILYTLDMRELNTKTIYMSSLCGSRPLQIMKLLKQNQGVFHGFIKSEEEKNKVDKYVSGKYSGKVDVQIFKGDIYKNIYKTNRKYNYIDLDTINALTDDHIDKIIDVAHFSMASKGVLSITHMHRNMTKEKVIKNIGKLIDRLQMHKKVKYHHHYRYFNTAFAYRDTFVFG
jgi:hypothetical protein